MANEVVARIPLNVQNNVVGIKNPDGKTMSYHIRARIADIPCNIPMKPNARNSRLTARTCKSMLHTLENSPEKFVTKNGGIVLSAKNVTTRKDALLIRFPDSDLYGDIDGGHTLAAISKYNADTFGKLTKEQRDKAQVNIEIITGITSKNEIADIVKGRNDKLSVKRIDIFNQDSSSNDIKALLKNTSFYDNICFKTNTVGKNVKFMNVLELLYRFNKINISFTEDTGMADNVNNTKTTSSITLFERTICAKRNFEFYKKNWKFYKTMFTLFEKFDRDCNKYLRAYVGKRRRSALIDSNKYETEKEIKSMQFLGLPEKMAIACSTVFMPFIKAHGTLDNDGYIKTVDAIEWTTDIVKFYEKNKKMFFSVLEHDVFKELQTNIITNGTLPNTIDYQKVFCSIRRRFSSYIMIEATGRSFVK